MHVLVVCLRVCLGGEGGDYFMTSVRPDLPNTQQTRKGTEESTADWLMEPFGMPVCLPTRTFYCRQESSNITVHPPTPPLILLKAGFNILGIVHIYQQ